MADLSFGLMIALLIAHELDAMKRHEWRILPLTSFLPEKLAEQVFLWAHVPLTLLVLWVFAQGPESGAALGVSGFAVLHVGLHWLFRNHPDNEFTGFAAWLPIIGAGGFGGFHVVAVV